MNNPTRMLELDGIKRGTSFAFPKGLSGAIVTLLDTKEAISKQDKPYVWWPAEGGGKKFGVTQYFWASDECLVVDNGVTKTFLELKEEFAASDYTYFNVPTELKVNTKFLRKNDEGYDIVEVTILNFQDSWFTKSAQEAPARGTR